MLRVLRFRDFRLVWSAGLISMIGDWALRAGLPFEVYRLTGSTLATAAYFLAGLIPQVLFGSTAGVFVDRWDRRRLMIWVNVALAISLLPLLAVDAVGVWIVYATVVVTVILGLLFAPAEIAVLPQLVGPEHLVEANSLSSLNRNLSRLIGPALGGVAVALFGLAGVVAIDALSFVIAALLIALIAPRPEFKPALQLHALDEHGVAVAPVGSAISRVVAELGDGIAQARTSSLLMAMLLFSLITAIGEGVLGALFVPWTTDILHGNDLVFAALLSTQAIGGLAGAFLVGRYLRNVAPARLLGMGAVLFGLIDLVLFTYPVLAPVIWPALVGMVIVGIPATAMQVGGTTIQQTEVADSHRGRVVGLWMTAMATGAIVGTTIGGLFGQALGILPLLVIQGAGYALSGLMVLYVARRIRRSAAAAAVAGAALADQPALATDVALASDQ
jgi:predicted MFS family arabinose efflux permease